ncbi:uncharacterized protein DNG_07535 [Cephalotrichum gorgonifer]|uniref:Ataxin-10 homolog n=1 Tax=Cephalotrichum gorgonifer TaxID=2041049 RepID=A0AAE8N1Z1_9PEZI|nr:uncharacterized protein DNG_07535 [Cephalotrichum gorgonifer]
MSAESSGSPASPPPPPPPAQPGPSPARAESIEERGLLASLITLESHFTRRPVLGPKSTCQAITMLSKSLGRTQDEDIRTRKFGPNVEIWVYLRRIFATAIPSLANRALGPLEGPDVAASYPQSTALIVKNYATIKEDVQLLEIMMQIARNVLVSDSRPVPQDLCAAARFDKMAYKTILLCAYVTNNSKGPADGEVSADNLEKAFEIHDLFKRLLVTTLQQAHNWVVGHHWNKMQLFLDVLFDEGEVDTAPVGEGQQRQLPELDTEVVRVEIQNWLARNSKLDPAAAALLRDYTEHHSKKASGPLEAMSPLAWNWLPEGSVDVPAQDDGSAPFWNVDAPTKWDQDLQYRRTSHEIDTWWTQAMDPGSEGSTKPMHTVAFAKGQLDASRQSLLARCAAASSAAKEAQTAGGAHPASAAAYNYNLRLDEGDDGMTSGILTEIPNILDPRQIEALYMIIKTCVLDSHGDGLSPSGENLQKTRCKMFLALNSGRSLFREMLVYVGIWVLDDTSLVYNVMRDIVLALHQNLLIPYAWNRLRAHKHFISPAQSMLLRLVGDLFCTSRSNPETLTAPEKARLVKLVHFLFGFFRSRVVPEYAAVMYLQTRVREGAIPGAEFPMHYWEMQRAKAALVQYLEFLLLVAEVKETRELLIEWEAVYDLITLLVALEGAVPKLPLVDVTTGQPRAVPQPGAAGADHARAGGYPRSEYEDSESESLDSTQPLESPHAASASRDQASRYAWSGTKAPIFTILATLLQPPSGRSTPGNPTVQRQILRNNGLAALLNCVTYDGHQPLSRERVTLCLKWLVEGNKDATEWFKELFRHSEGGGSRRGSSSKAARLAPARARVSYRGWRRGPRPRRRGGERTTTTRSPPTWRSGASGWTA